MAVKKIVKYGEKTLREPSKEVHKVSKKITELVQDMLDTMYAQNGCGLAAPQIGVNYRVFVIDVSSNDEPLKPMVFINPKIIKKSGAFIGEEGCLSFSTAYIQVKRYKNVLMKALDINGKPFIIEAKDGSLLSKALQHEYDHLDGILYIDRCADINDTEITLEKFNFPPIEKEKLITDPDLEKEFSND